MDGVKGTVTPLGSLFSVDDAQKAVKRVENSIAEYQKELDQLNHFISDNTNLVNLVQRLPNELSHNIMVPFGKAAFFPGRLIHTNEFLVLLGEGYYAERTSKQTAEFLHRRKNLLDSQVESFKAMMQDLRAEASFFGAAAADVAEGLVEIMEEYVEEHPKEAPRVEVAAEDEEYAQIMAKFDELEEEEREEELEAERLGVESEDEEYDRIMARMDELLKLEREAERVGEANEDRDTVTDFGCSISQDSLEQKVKILEEHQVGDSLKKPSSDNFHTRTIKPVLQAQSEQVSIDLSTFEDLKVQHPPKDANLRGGVSADMDESNATNIKPPAYPQKKSVHFGPTTSYEDSSSTPNPLADSKKISEDNARGRSHNTGFDSSKAFTGSIVEHSHDTNLEGKIKASSQSTSSKPSKPVSRFKLQKGGH